MDPITAAIVAALTLGASGAVTEASKMAIMNAYRALKAKITEKYGTTSDVVRAVEDLEARPVSEGKRTVLVEEIATNQGTEDADLLHAAQSLLEQISTISAGREHIRSIVGNYNTLVQGSGNTTTVTFSHPKEP